MKNIIFFCATILALAAVPFLIINKESTLAEGRTMLLRLAPRDPRSLMQGDYMVLRYAMDNAVPSEELESKGCLVVKLDANNVATFVQIHKGEKLQDGEYLLSYRKRGELRLGAESFMFQEGDAEIYASAWYGELKVDKEGSSVLVGLCGEDLQPLKRKKTAK
jgi:uncharacterized membrane-anchored protein